MNNLNRHSRRIGVPAGTVLLVAGCGLANIGGGAGRRVIVLFADSLPARFHRAS